MFEGVDDINWEHFGESHIAVGMKTREIPDCIRDMLNEDPETREYSIASLLGEGQHLGMLGKATPYIIPYVLEVLENQNYEQRGYLLFGLAKMFDHMFRSRSFDHLRLAIQIYDEIKKGYSIYKHLLNDHDKWVRCYTINIMGYMQDNSEDAVAQMLNQFAVETDGEVRSDLIEAILKLVKDSFSLYSKAGTQTIVSLHGYLKDKSSFKEQIQFARAVKEMGLIYHLRQDIMTFIQETLVRADAEGKQPTSSSD